MKTDKPIYFQSREEDWNRDGKADGLDLHLEMPLQDMEKVTGVKLILIFQYKLFVSSQRNIALFRFL